MSDLATRLEEARQRLRSRETWQAMLRTPMTSWIYIAVLAGVTAGLLACLPLAVIFPHAPKAVAGLVWLVVASLVAMLWGIRLERFASGSRNENEVEK